MGEELLIQLMNTLVEINEHCNNMPERSDNKAKCVNCAFSRYFNYMNSGCILVQIKEDGLLEDLFSTMKYQGINSEEYLRLED